ncbi:MAG: SDR family NAD(P)-dependent oxidoreductase, partial [Pseudomonadota bacterium]
GLPRPPGLVICAIGAMPPQAEIQDRPEAVRRVIDANFAGPALLLEAAAARLAAQPGPTALIGIGSVAGDRGRAVNYWYGASKAGFEAALSGLRQRHARGGPLVVTVKPGYVDTPMTEGMDLPSALTLSAEAQAAQILRALDRRRPLVMDLRWRLIMAALRLIPERLWA